MRFLYTIILVVSMLFFTKGVYANSEQILKEIIALGTEGKVWCSYIYGIHSKAADIPMVNKKNTEVGELPHRKLDVSFYYNPENKLPVVTKVECREKDLQDITFKDLIKVFPPQVNRDSINVMILDEHFTYQYILGEYKLTFHLKKTNDQYVLTNYYIRPLA